MKQLHSSNLNNETFPIKLIINIIDREYLFNLNSALHLNELSTLITIN